MYWGVSRADRKGIPMPTYFTLTFMRAKKNDLRIRALEYVSFLGKVPF